MQSDKIKILTFLLPRRGCLPYATQLLAELRGVENKLYTSAYALENPLKDTEKVRTYRNAPEALWSTIWELPRLLWRVRRDAQQGYRTAYFPAFHHWNLPLLMYCRILGMRTIYTVHNAVLHAGEDHLLNRYWQRRCMRLADELICLTRYVAGQCRQMLGEGKPIHIIPHPLLQLPGLEPPPRTLSARPRLLMLGRIEAYKGLDLLLEALSHLSAEDISEVVIAGRAAIPIDVRTGDIPIHQIDRRLSEAEMVRWLQESDILVMPYTGASQSGILTLAVTAALPVVCSRVGGLPEQLAEDEAVWVDPTAEDIARGIRLLASDAGLYRRLHERLMEKREDQGWTAAAERLRDVIRDGSPQFAK